MRRGLIFLAAALSTGPALARDPVLTLPVDCDLGRTCFIQQYVDADPGPGAADFTCGSLSYDGHRGTDFALPSRAMMEVGVNVLAAAPGTVRNVRDGMPDIAVNAPQATSVDGRECGNRVIINHGGGWETQYCHLYEGSISVIEGQRVGAGTALGQVGLSGRTVFPHVHLSVRHNGAVVDPFNPDGIVFCGETDTQTLWKDPVAYVPGGLIAAGFSAEVPNYDTVKAGVVNEYGLGRSSPKLVLWTYAFGARAGDILRVAITGPDGELLVQNLDLDHAQAQFFRAVSKQAPPDGWAVGRYSGQTSLVRGNRVLDRIAVELLLD